LDYFFRVPKSTAFTPSEPNMKEPDIQTRFDDFFCAADAYLREPGVLTGLELDEKAGRVRQSCFNRLQDETLGRSVEAVLSHLRRQESEEIRILVDDIAARLKTHALVANRAS
jgi:hypothetical protein